MFDLTCPASHVSLTGCVQLPIPAINLQKATNNWDMSIWPQCNVLYQSGYIYAFYTRLSSPNVFGGRAIERIRKNIGSVPNTSWEAPITSYQSTGVLNSNSLYLSASCTGADGKFWIAFTEGTPSGNFVRLKSSVNQGVSWVDVGDINFNSSDGTLQTAAYSLIDDVDNLLVGFRMIAGADEGRVGINKISKTNGSLIISGVDIISAAMASASGWTSSSRYTEPMLIRDPITTGKIVGWIRHNDSDAKPMWVVSNNNGVSWTRAQYTPSNLSARALNLPVTRIGDHYITLAAERYNSHRIQVWSIPVNDTNNGADLRNLSVKTLGAYAGRENDISSDPSSNAGGVSINNVAYFLFGVIDTDSYQTPSTGTLGPSNLWQLSLDYSTSTPQILPEHFSQQSIQRKPVRIFNGAQPMAVIVSANTLHINTSSSSATVFQLEDIGEIGDFVEFLSTGTYGIQINCGTSGILVRSTGETITGENFIKPGGDKRIVILQKIAPYTWMECSIEPLLYASGGFTTESHKSFATTSAGKIGFYFGGTLASNKGGEFSIDGLRIKGESTMTHLIKASTTWSPGAINAGQTAITGLTVNTVNNSGTARYISVYPPVRNGAIIWGEVSGNNVVNLNAYNPTTGVITPTVATYQLIFTSVD